MYPSIHENMHLENKDLLSISLCHAISDSIFSSLHLIMEKFWLRKFKWFAHILTRRKGQNKAWYLLSPAYSVSSWRKLGRHVFHK